MPCCAQRPPRSLLLLLNKLPQTLNNPPRVPFLDGQRAWCLSLKRESERERVYWEQILHSLVDNVLVG
jgi:hypothetical protein